VWVWEARGPEGGVPAVAGPGHPGPAAVAASVVAPHRERSRLPRRQTTGRREAAGALLLRGDRLAELVLRHAGAALDSELRGALVQLPLAVALDVDAAVALAPALTGPGWRARGSEGPFLAFFTQRSPFVSNLCFSAE
jgi:hypothetical protein